MQKFTIFTSSALPLRVDNIDTDQIIPARFLRTVKREDFGEMLFYDLRFDEKGKEKKDSILADRRYKNAQILLTGKNFGVGSSREHAVWAIKDYGFRVVIATSFGDIFYNNALKNGLLAVQLRERQVNCLFTLVKKNPSRQITVNLLNQQVSTGGEKFSFTIDSFPKTCLIKGIDELGYLLNLNLSPPGCNSFTPRVIDEK